MKVLIDTNVLLSAALRDRLPERVVLFAASRDDWRWIVTADILREYREVLRRPKFALATDVLARWDELLGLRAVDLGSPPPVEFPRDPKDAPFLAAAIAFQADLLITGDADLLSLGAAQSCKILSASAFAQEFGVT